MLSDKKISSFVIVYLVDTFLFLGILLLFRYGSQHDNIGWIRVSVFIYLLWLGYTIFFYSMKVSVMSVLHHHYIRLFTFYSFLLLLYFVLFYRKTRNKSRILSNFLQNKEEPNEECMEIILSSLQDWKDWKEDHQKVLYINSLFLLSMILQKTDRVTSNLIRKYFTQIVSIITETLQTISSNNQEFMVYYQSYEEGVRVLINILFNLVLRSGFLMNVDVELLTLSDMMSTKIPTVQADVLLGIFHLECLILVSDTFKKKQDLYPKTYLQYTKAYTHCLLNGVHKIIYIIVHNDDLPKGHNLIEYVRNYDWNYVRTYVHLCFIFLEHFAINQFDLLSSLTKEFNGKTISIGFFIYKTLWYTSYFSEYYQFQNIKEHIIKILKKNKTIDSLILKFQSKKNKTRKGQRNPYPNHYQHKQDEIFKMQQ